ncbi:LpqB family beta-propeller domain-containing protein [Aeromicrobium sp. IC_218]|uniref:LpqB family beta-propeller domain-containing protein n=1 Tax=Aeromicrobium sp. IC_218 TaxID=2545468 RepID=UPI00103EC6EB|nr:LpqB family beta-propeller domain-containing protein [Aeromicrobium sp. IC_218]TCI95688.1 hypothetical protein E0W78_16105 [Aeromicrobium sp. IC_218]
MTTRRVLAWLLVAVCALSACGGIPDEVRVHRVGADQGTGESPVSYRPAGPRQNATPDQVVRGYLDAMLAYPVSSGTAEEFLHPQAEPWDPTAGVVVYRAASVEEARQVAIGRDIGLEVVVRLEEQARLDRTGHYEPSVRTRTVSFVLRRASGQWRIEVAPPGTFVTDDFFADYYRPFDLYFFDPSGSRVVADPVHLPLGDQVATALVTNLVAGPRDQDAGTLRSFVPDAARLRGSVPVAADGLADIVIDGLADVSSDTRDRVSAQLVWTLRQLPEVRTLRIRPPGPVVRAESGDLEPVGGWGVFGPSRAWAGPFALLGGAVVSLADGAPEVLEQRLVQGGDVESFTVAPGAESLAAVTSGGSELVLGPVSGQGRRRVPGSGLLPPVWDASGRVWAVDRADGRTRVRLIGAEDVTLALAGWPRLDPLSFALSRDQARYSLVARAGDRTQVLVGRVLSDAQGRVTGLSVPRPLPSGTPLVTASFTSPRSVSFAGSGHVVVAATSVAGEQQVFTARVDGSSVTGGRSSDGPTLVDVDAQQVVADPVTGRLFVRAGDGTVWQTDGAAAWTRIDVDGVRALAPTG